MTSSVHRCADYGLHFEGIFKRLLELAILELLCGDFSVARQ